MEMYYNNVVLRIPADDIFAAVLPDLLNVGIFKAWDYGFLTDEQNRPCAKVYEKVNPKIFFTLPVAFLETIKNPHSVFWVMIKDLPYYKDADRIKIKSRFVYKFSHGRTESLSELFQQNPVAYNIMLESIKSEIEERGDRLNQERKKLLSVIYNFCNAAGYEINKEKALTMAKRACKVHDLNMASEQTLIAAIKSFETQNSDAWFRGLLRRFSLN